MSREFYHPDVTERSWRMLQRLHSTFSFTLIGGWAAWCYTQGPKSRDIDIVVDYATLGTLRTEYAVVKNDRLRQYEVPLDGFDIDIYVPHYSTTLAVPPEQLLSRTLSVQGFAVPPVEALLALKIVAWADRRASVHGAKDFADILGLLPLASATRWATLPRDFQLSAPQIRRLQDASTTLAAHLPRRWRDHLGLPDSRRAPPPPGPRLSR